MSISGGKDTLEGLEVAQTVNFMGVSASVLLVVDFIQTFPDEVRLMWPTPRSGPKTVFYILRYYALVHSVFYLIYGLPKGQTPEQCRIAFVRTAVSSMLAVTASEVILYIRVYAFSERNKRLLAFLVALFVVIHSTAYTLFALFIKSVEYVQSPFPNFVCVAGHAESFWLGSVFSATLASVLVVMLIMIYIAYRDYRGVSNSLLSVFYRDGISYFASLSVLASANIFINFIAPGMYKFLFLEMEVAIHVILSTRMLLHLRLWAEQHTLPPPLKTISQ